MSWDVARLGGWPDWVGKTLIDVWCTIKMSSEALNRSDAWKGSLIEGVWENWCRWFGLMCVIPSDRTLTTVSEVLSPFIIPASPTCKIYIVLRFDYWDKKCAKEARCCGDKGFQLLYAKLQVQREVSKQTRCYNSTLAKWREHPELLQHFYYSSGKPSRFWDSDLSI